MIIQEDEPLCGVDLLGNVAAKRNTLQRWVEGGRQGPLVA